MRTAREIIEKLGLDSRKPTSDDFVRANTFLVELHKFRHMLKADEMSLLRKQAINGDIPGAWRGLERLVREYQGGGTG